MGSSGAPGPGSEVDLLEVDLLQVVQTPSSTYKNSAVINVLTKN
jgi:hypothetical protein